jgi:protein SCO1
MMLAAARLLQLSCPGLTRAPIRQAADRPQDSPWTLGLSPGVAERGQPQGNPSVLPALGLVFAVLAWPMLAQAHEAADQEEHRLPTIGPAPDFALTSQDGEEVTLESLRGKVLAVAFIYTWCPDICPMLTDKMARVQDELGADFGTEVAFVSITFDPERDTPEVLKEYAEAFDADLEGWSFLTGEPEIVREVARRYGVAVAAGPEGQIDHSLLTTLVDRHGTMRVQYLGYRFDPEEFRHDLLELVNEP